MDRLTSVRRPDGRDALAQYLARNGLDPALAGGPVGDRALALGLAYGAKPADVFAHWIAELFDVRVDEAEDLGWIALLASGLSPNEVLFARDLDAPARAAMAARVLLPKVEHRLAMPAQAWRGSARAGGWFGLPADRRA